MVRDVKSHAVRLAVSSAAVVVSMGWDRLVIAVAILAGVTYLTAIGKISNEATVGVYTAILGYIFGRAQGENGTTSTPDKG